MIARTLGQVAVMLTFAAFLVLAPGTASVWAQDEFPDMGPNMEFEFDEHAFGEPEGPPAVAMAMVLLVYGAIFAVALGVKILIIYLFYSTLKAVPEEYREMQPGMVWLLLIPLFELVWNFFVGTQIPKSYQRYFAAQGRTDVGDCGESLGLWWAICIALSVIPCVGCISGPAALVMMIMLLVKLYGLKGQIVAKPAY